MQMKVKLFDKDIEYLKRMKEYFDSHFSGRILLCPIPVSEEKNVSQILREFIDDMDLYMIDIKLFEAFYKILPVDKTVVIRNASDSAKIQGVKMIAKYQKPLSILEELERFYYESQALNGKKALFRNRIIKLVKDRVINDAEIISMSDEQVRQKISDLVEEQLRINEFNVGLPFKSEIVQTIYSSIRGYGLLDKLLADETITEVMINGHDNIFVERNGKVSRYEDCFESPEQLEDMIQKIVGKAGREVNQASPIVDTRLSDGSRVNVVLPPIALQGPTMTIRKFSKDPMTMQNLIELGSVTPEVADFLKTLVRARYNIFISGGTGSGKTTFLNALSNFIPKNERIITIEDSAELKIEGIENLVSMETRNANATGTGEVPMKTLIKSSLRMRPDRIIVGEVRGVEALDMLQAMNTGHDGSLSTGHANSSEDMLSRLETMILQNSDGIPLAALRRQIASSLDIIIHLSRMMDHSRKVLEISEVLGVDDSGNVQIRPIYKFNNGRLERTEYTMQNLGKLKMAGLVLGDSQCKE